VSLLELQGVGISAGGRQPIAGLDLTLEAGASLAIVGRARSGKSLLAAAIVGQLGKGGRIDGRLQATGRVALVGAGAGVAELERILALKPQLIVGDEPGGSLPPDEQRSLLTAMQGASRDRGVGLLILTSDFRLPLAMQLETAILDGGRLVERGNAGYLLDHPRQPATRDLTGNNRPRTRTMARPPVGEPLLELHGVGKRFGGPLRRLWEARPATAALESLTFSVRRGEAVGLLGPAGSGKSLLLRLIGGIGWVSDGQMGFDRHAYRGADIPREVRARLAFLSPDPHAAFNPSLAVGLTLTEPMRVEEQLLIEEQADRLVEVVRVVGLEPDVLGRPPASFTPFELQRLALARALVGRPRLIVLDEPTARLDPVEQGEFLVLFNRVRADYGLTVLAASRRFDVLRAIADRILVLDHGRIVEGGKPAELLESAQHEATRALLAPRYPEPLAPTPSEPEPEPEPVIEASPPVVPAVTATAPVELAPNPAPPPVPAPGEPGVAEVLPAEPLAASQPETAVAMLELGHQPAEELSPTLEPAEPAGTSGDEEPVASGEPPADELEPEPVEPFEAWESVDTPAPPGTSEPAPGVVDHPEPPVPEGPAPEAPAEPASADDGADKTAESGQVDLPAGRGGDGAGSVEPADGEPVR